MEKYEVRLTLRDSNANSVTYKLYLCDNEQHAKWYCNMVRNIIESKYPIMEGDIKYGLVYGKAKDINVEIYYRKVEIPQPDELLSLIENGKDIISKSVENDIKIRKELGLC